MLLTIWHGEKCTLMRRSVPRKWESFLLLGLFVTAIYCLDHGFLYKILTARIVQSGL